MMPQIEITSYRHTQLLCGISISLFWVNGLNYNTVYNIDSNKILEKYDNASYTSWHLVVFLS